MNKYAVAFLTSSNYYIYTQVALLSFVGHNQWFIENNYDIIIILCEDIDNFNKGIFQKIYPNIIFINNENSKWKDLLLYYYNKTELINDQLAYNSFYNKDNKFNRYLDRFIIFDLKEYDKIIYFDSDIIINQSCYDLFVNDTNQFSIALHSSYHELLDNKYINYNDFINKYNYNEPIGTCTGILICNPKTNTSISFEQLKQFIKENYNKEKNLGYYQIDEILINDYLFYQSKEIGNNIYILPQNIMAYNDSIISDITQYKCIHYFFDPLSDFIQNSNMSILWNNYLFKLLNMIYYKK